MRICAERYLQIAEYQRQSNEARAAMQLKLDASFKALYALIWKAAFGVIAALGGVVFFLVQRVIEQRRTDLSTACRRVSAQSEANREAAGADMTPYYAAMLERSAQIKSVHPKPSS